MKILFAVPSKNRVEIFEKYALPWLKCLEGSVTVFVEPQDYEKYDKFFEGNIEVVDIKENDKGLWFVKEFIQKFAAANGYDLVFKIDDDTKGFTDYRISAKTPEETAKNVKKFLALFEEQVWHHKEIKAIAFPYSFHMFDDFDFKPVKKVQSTYLVRTEFLTVEGKNFSVFEDFAVGLNIVVNNGFVMKYGRSGQMVGVPVGGGTGGHQDFDRRKLAEVEAGLLREIYPPLLFCKVNKSWGIEPDMRSIKMDNRGK